MGSAIVLAEAEAYKDMDAGRLPLSHTAGIVMKHKIQLLKPTGQDPTPAEKGVAVLSILAPNAEKPDYYYLYPDEWNIKPDDVEKITRTVYTEKQAQETTGQVLMNGEWEGEDIPLYDFELKQKKNLLEKLLHPARNIGHDQPSKVLRLGFENQHEAEEWYALVAIAMQTMPHDHQRLEKLPLARAASTKMLPSSVIAEGAAYKDK